MSESEAMDSTELSDLLRLKRKAELELEKEARDRGEKEAKIEGEKEIEMKEEEETKVEGEKEIEMKEEEETKVEGEKEIEMKEEEETKVEGEKEIEMKEEEEMDMEEILAYKTYTEKEIDDMTDGELEIAIRKEEKMVEKLKAGTIIEPPKWGYDSFGSVEYISSDDAQPVSDDDDEYRAKMKIWNEDYRKYKRQIIESKGFWGDPEIDWSLRYKKIYPMPLDSKLGPDSTRTFRELFLEMVHVCLDKLNHDKEPKVEFDRLVRGNFRNGPRCKAYITFMAKEKSDGTPVEYQAKCMRTMDRMLHPMLCRRAPTV